jgi:hypothetical protein
MVAASLLVCNDFTASGAEHRSGDVLEALDTLLRISAAEFLDIRRRLLYT